MKSINIVALSAVALALLAGGCRYNKAAKGAGGAGDADGVDITGAESVTTSGDLSSIGENRFEDLYARCTDVEFEAIYFGFDSTVVPPAELGKADSVARHLVDNPSRVVVVEGNCDERGSNEYNMSLGELRAQTVRNYLLNSGIDASRIQTRSFGEEKPASEGHNESSWARNRRDEFAIFDTSVKK